MIEGDEKKIGDDPTRLKNIGRPRTRTYLSLEGDHKKANIKGSNREDRLGQTAHQEGKRIRSSLPYREKRGKGGRKKCFEKPVRIPKGHHTGGGWSS